MKYSYVLGVLCMFASLIANADSGESNKSKVVGIGITDSRGSSIGLKFTPPNEDGWTMERSGLSVSLKKNAATARDSQEIEAYLIRLDSPISSISNYVETVKRNTRESYASSTLFKINTLEVTEDPRDGRCARVHLKLEAIQPEQVIRERTWSEQYSLSCGLVKHQGLGFELRYYHRYSDSNAGQQFIEAAGRVLDSVEIDDN